MVAEALAVEFQMSLLLFVALLGYLVASRINQSAVIGEILVGIFIGPSFLGLITYTNFVESLAHLGAVILLFVVGLEFNMRGLYRVENAVVAFFGVVVPWVCGFFLSSSFGFDFNVSVFIGTALTATSIAITANVLKEMGHLTSRAAKLIIGAAVIDDVLGLLALSFSTQMVSGSISYSVMFLTAFKAIVFLVAGSLVGRKVIVSWIKRIDESSMADRYPEVVFIFAMMIAFFYSMCAELIGLSAIVGAFIAGVSMEGVRLRKSRDMKEGAEYLYIIFAAIFFVSLGIIADVHALDSEVILFLIVLSVVAVLTKVVGCGIPAKYMGLSVRDSMIVGFGMSPRGEVAMIVALIGLTKGIIPQNIYVTLVLMSLLTTILTPLVLKRLYPQTKKRLT